LEEGASRETGREVYVTEHSGEFLFLNDYYFYFICDDTNNWFLYLCYFWLFEK
jgi:hypothetical protein